MRSRLPGSWSTFRTMNHSIVSSLIIQLARCRFMVALSECIHWAWSPCLTRGEYTYHLSPINFKPFLNQIFDCEHEELLCWGVRTIRRCSHNKQVIVRDANTIYTVPQHNTSTPVQEPQLVVTWRIDHIVSNSRDALRNSSCRDGANRMQPVHPMMRYADSGVIWF